MCVCVHKTVPIYRNYDRELSICSRLTRAESNWPRALTNWPKRILLFNANYFVYLSINNQLSYNQFSLQSEQLAKHESNNNNTDVPNNFH